MSSILTGSTICSFKSNILECCLWAALGPFEDLDTHGTQRKAKAGVQPRTIGGLDAQLIARNVAIATRCWTPTRSAMRDRRLASLTLINGLCRPSWEHSLAS